MAVPSIGSMWRVQAQGSLAQEGCSHKVNTLVLDPAEGSLRWLVEACGSVSGSAHRWPFKPTPRPVSGQSDLKNGPGLGKTTPEPTTSSERKKFYTLSSIFHSLNLVIYFVLSVTV